MRIVSFYRQKQFYVGVFGVNSEWGKWAKRNYYTIIIPNVGLVFFYFSSVDLKTQKKNINYNNCIVKARAKTL